MFKKNWYLFTPLILVLIPAAIFLYYSSSVGYETQDAVNATKYFLTSGTRYTMNYDERNFARVRPGMEPLQLVNLVGKQPFERLDNDTRWVFALPKPGATAYHERAVIMERDSQGVTRVKSLIRRFHVPGE